MPKATFYWKKTCSTCRKAKSFLDESGARFDEVDLARGLSVEELEAKIARARNDAPGEIEHLKRAVALQEKLAYMEPPEWHYPIREALGGALLRMGRAAEAEAIFREDLRLNPRNGRSLFGLLEALKMQGETVGVEWVKKEFAEAWKYAPTSLKISDL